MTCEASCFAKQSEQLIQVWGVNIPSSSVSLSSASGAPGEHPTF